MLAGPADDAPLPQCKAPTIPSNYLGDPTQESTKSHLVLCEVEDEDFSSFNLCLLILCSFVPRTVSKH